MIHSPLLRKYATRHLRFTMHTSWRCVPMIDCRRGNNQDSTTGPGIFSIVCEITLNTLQSKPTSPNHPCNCPSENCTQAVAHTLKYSLTLRCIIKTACTRASNRNAYQSILARHDQGHSKIGMDHCRFHLNCIGCSVALCTFSSREVHDFWRTWVIILSNRNSIDRFAFWNIREIREP